MGGDVPITKSTFFTFHAVQTEQTMNDKNETMRQTKDLCSEG